MTEKGNDAREKIRPPSPFFGLAAALLMRQTDLPVPYREPSLPRSRRGSA